MLTVYLKPTNFCNVDCDHCYLTQEVRADRTRMDEATMRKSAILLRDLAKAQRESEIHIIWHGGEPLVLPARYFEKMGAILDEELPGHTESLQTSLIPLNDDHVDWIKNRLGSFAGSSMDFSSRTTKDGPEGYQKLWMTKVDKCRNNGIEVVPGITPSVSELQKAAWINDWMISRGFGRFNIERYNSFGFDAPGHPSNRQHSDFLWDLYVDTITRVLDGRSYALIRVLGAAIGGVLHGTPGDRWGGSCQRDFIVIEPNGFLNNCPDKSSKEEGYSHIDDGAKGFLASPMRRKWIRIQAVGHRNSMCASCENSSWCKSGCPITCNTPEVDNDDCSGYKSFITRVRASLEDSQTRQAAVVYLEHIQQTSRRVLDGYGE